MVSTHHLRSYRCPLGRVRWGHRLFYLPRNERPFDLLRDERPIDLPCGRNRHLHKRSPIGTQWQKQKYRLRKLHPTVQVRSWASLWTGTPSGRAHAFKTSRVRKDTSLGSRQHLLNTSVVEADTCCAAFFFFAVSRVEMNQVHTRFRRELIRIFQ